VFAGFWILLAGVSGVYLFTVFTDPTALGGQLVKLTPLPEDGSASPASDGAASDGATAAIAGQTSEARDQELTEIKASLRELSQQMAELNARLKPIEKVVGPVAALPPSASVSTSLPVPPPIAPASAPPAAAAPPAPPPAEEAESPQAEAPQPAVDSAAEAKPVEQAAVEPAPTPAEPPQVAVSPIEEDPAEEAPEPSSDVSAPAPPAAPVEDVSPPAPAATESAALDPLALPPAANDGSTRYGIEIGIVTKQDGLRPLWREFLTNHGALVAGLQPRRVLAPDKKWRLIAGPFASAGEAAQACALFKKASRPCEATVYAGDAL
jgi:hypothetical protein